MQEVDDVNPFFATDYPAIALTCFGDPDPTAGLLCLRQGRAVEIHQSEK